VLKSINFVNLVWATDANNVICLCKSSAVAITSFWK